MKTFSSLFPLRINRTASFAGKFSTATAKSSRYSPVTNGRVNTSGRLGASNSSQTPSLAASFTKSASNTNIISWTEYFRLKQSRNRARIFAGLPSMFGGYLAAASVIEFSPFEQIMGMDPVAIIGMCTLSIGLAAYQVGAVLGHLTWRLIHSDKRRIMDQMDRRFFTKINHYRSGRSNSTYLTTQGGNAKLVAALQNKQQSSAGRVDFYGESIKSVRDYRAWLRKERKWERDHSVEQVRPMLHGAP